MALGQLQHGIRTVTTWHQDSYNMTLKNLQHDIRTVTTKEKRWVTKQEMLGKGNNTGNQFV